MTNDFPLRPEKAAKARRKHVPAPHVEPDLKPLLIQVERSGDWMPAEELRETALAASTQGKDVTLDLDRVDHLDASALQILLALDTDLKNRGQKLRLAKASEHLRKWFVFAGADDRFLMTGQMSDE